MAHLHFRRTVYKGGGGKASARIEYMTSRTAQTYSASARQLAYIAKPGREDLVYEASRNLPAWAAGSPHTFFQAAERYEAKQAVSWNAFEEWKVTLPVELTRTQNRELVEDLIDMIAGERLPCTYAFHAPLTMDGAHEQPHIHVLLSTRQNDETPRDAATHFKRWDRQHPERGGARKDEAFRVRGAVKAHRLMVSDMLNLHLERHGLAARVHPDTLEQRGIARTPEPKLAPSESQAYREKGRVSRGVAAVLRIRTDREKTRTKESNQAYAAWEQRKHFLGMTRAMPHEVKLARLLLKRHGSVERVPARYRAAVDWDVPRPRPREKQSLTAQLAALLARADGAAPVPGRGLRVQVFEREEAPGREW